MLFEMGPDKVSSNHPKPVLPDGLFSDQKSHFGVNFGGSCKRRCWHILWKFCRFYVHLIYSNPNFGRFWYILWLCIWSIFRPFCIFYGHLVYCNKKNLATLCTGRSVFKSRHEKRIQKTKSG
jgi:hypothetical protein